MSTSVLLNFPRVWLSVMCAIVACLGLTGCVDLKVYRSALPGPAGPQPCAAVSALSSPGVADCADQSSETNAQYTMHVVEFDDEGWPFDGANGQVQIDSAIDQIKGQLKGTSDCVRLFVYVHGWRHNASTTDSNVVNFRAFLGQVAAATTAASSAGKDVCEDPAIAARGATQKPGGSASVVRKPRPAAVKTVGIYVGWRGLSVIDVRPLVYASFWDRKNTADRVAQGSVRELFGRLNALARYAPASGKRLTAPSQTQAQLRTYVIGHSFGASVAFRALSQSLIDSFSEDIDADPEGEPTSISRFVDMVVLVNPAIEAARFDPVFRAAKKLRTTCLTRQPNDPLCDRPIYQAPVLAVFTSEGDLATKRAFPIRASLSNLFERTLGPAQRQSIVQTIGWDENYQTHRLSIPVRCEPSQADPFDPSETTPRYRPPGWAWCFLAGTGPMLLTHLGATPRAAEEGIVYNGPIWNVRVPKTIMSDHNDTWNDSFRELLLYLFTNERQFRSTI